MFAVMDYGDRKGPELNVPGIRIANTDRKDFLFMGPWKPMMECRGFPDAGGQNVLDLLYEKIKMAGEKADYVCLGQLTALACLMMTHPDVTSYLRRVLICPGERNKDRKHPVSEEHILLDPVAARIVLNGGMPKEIMAEKTRTAQYEAAKQCLTFGEASCTEAPWVYATAVLDQGCSYGSLYIDKLNICKREPNVRLIGGCYNGKDTGNH